MSPDVALTIGQHSLSVSLCHALKLAALPSYLCTTARCLSHVALLLPQPVGGPDVRAMSNAVKPLHLPTLPVFSGKVFLKSGQLLQQQPAAGPSSAFQLQPT